MPERSLEDWLADQTAEPARSIGDEASALAGFGVRVEVRARTLACRLILIDVAPLGAAPCSSPRIPIEWPSDVLVARRILDALEAWLLCPCGHHTRHVNSYFPLLELDESRTWGRVAAWAARPILDDEHRAPDAGVLETALQHAGAISSAAAPLTSEFRARLRSWSRGDQDTIDRLQWLPGTTDLFIRLPDAPPIDWRCQECASLVVQTADRLPSESEDSDCLDHPERNCTAGYSMNMEAYCSRCGADLDWGESLCSCFQALRL